MCNLQLLGYPLVIRAENDDSMAQIYFDIFDDVIFFS